MTPHPELLIQLVTMEMPFGKYKELNCPSYQCFTWNGLIEMVFQKEN